MILRLALVCQAPTAAVRTASFPADEPLDGPGLEKAKAVSHRFHGASDYVSSPALAARQTAEAMNLPARIEPELRECDYGRWAGRSLDEVHAGDQDGTAQWLADPSSCPHGGESMQTLLERVSMWLAAFEDQAGKIIAVTHSSIIRAAIVAVLNAPPRAVWRIDISPLSMTQMRRSAGLWTLSESNRPLRPTRKT